MPWKHGYYCCVSCGKLIGDATLEGGGLCECGNHIVTCWFILRILESTDFDTSMCGSCSHKFICWT